MRSFTFALLGTALLGANLAAHAASFCATTSAELQADLAAAASNNQDNTIDVHLGTYAVPAGGFMYDTITNNHSLDLEGGWYGSSPGQCLVQEFTGNDTELNGQGTDPVMNIQTSGTSGNITVRYFTFLNGLGDPPSLEIVATESTGAIRVEGSLFRGNHIKTDYANDQIVYVSSYVGVIYFLDNAIVDNVGFPSNSVYYVVLDLYSDDTTDTDAVYVNNNTIAGNTATDTSPPIGFYAEGNGMFTVSNNIVWDGSPDDIHNDSSIAPNMIFANNDVDGFYMTPTQSGDISLDPKFIDPANGNYRLMGNSPARDAGENSPPGTTRNVDLDGNPRVVFGTVDMGAYEIQDEIFAGSFGG